MIRDLLIEPRDPAMFRDGKPFAAGLGAESIGWPMPSSVIGHIRTRLWEPRSFQKPDFGDKQKSALLDVCQTGPLLACETENDGEWELAFPAPADAAAYRQDEDSPLEIEALRPAANESGGNGCDLPPGIVPLRGGRPGKVARDAPAFWTVEETLLWLETTGTATWTRPDRQLGYASLPEQSRIHVAIEKHKRNAKPSMLFRTVSREFDFDSGYRRGDGRDKRASQRFAIYSRISSDSDDWSPVAGAGAVGGERRVAVWTETESLLPAAPEESLKGDLLRMQLVTPAVFRDGWRPGWLDEGEPPGCPGLRLELVSAAIPRYQGISGFDMAQKGVARFRATRFVVPAGAVYFFRVLGGDPRDLWLKPVSDKEQDQRDGFGIVLTGGWQWR